MTATSNLIYYKYIALSFCGCYGFEVQLWHSTRQRGQRTTAGRTIGAFHSGVSSNCHIRTTAELNRYDGFQIPNSSQIVNLALCSTMLPDSWGLWTESPSLNNWPQWNNKHAVPHIWQMSKADGTLPAAQKKKICIAKRGKNRLERGKNKGDEKISKGIFWCKSRKRDDWLLHSLFPNR